MNWISVEDALPEVNTLILICLKSGLIITGYRRKYDDVSSCYYYEDDYYNFVYASSVKYWARIELPKEFKDK